jgi:hypothetical protein
VYIPIQCSPKAAAPSISVSHLELQPVVVGESLRAVIKITNSGALPCSYSIVLTAAAAANQPQQQLQQQMNDAESSDEHDGVDAAVPLASDSGKVSQYMCYLSMFSVLDVLACEAVVQLVIAPQPSMRACQRHTLLRASIMQI